ncbi:hypothetical protein PF003_g18774 [Phytophthora fragariae]|nr:hypothetical protein PF003_g18774 [Phytophthora fragariae]
MASTAEKRRERHRLASSGRARASHFKLEKNGSDSSANGTDC